MSGALLAGISDGLPSRRLSKEHLPVPRDRQDQRCAPSYVVADVVPLYRGGPDDPTNMRWQTRGSPRAKDRIEWAHQTSIAGDQEKTASMADEWHASAHHRRCASSPR